MIEQVLINLFMALVGFSLGWFTRDLRNVISEYVTKKTKK